jgi:NAD(P)-dependent dehydrogenase (short-subunit alcohol dehydrogenase family)
LSCSLAAFTKLLAIWWARSLQNQFDATDPPVPITAIAVHPGIVKTAWVKMFPQPLRWLVKTRMLKPERGSYNPLFAAASKQVATNKDKYKGVYLRAHPIGEIEKLGEAVVDDRRAKQLWETTEKFLRSIDL